MARTPGRPEAAPVEALSAQLSRSRSGVADSKYGAIKSRSQATAECSLWGMKTRSRGQDRAAVISFESGRSAASGQAA
jgi:hypothetical protein